MLVLHVPDVSDHVNRKRGRRGGGVEGVEGSQNLGPAHKRMRRCEGVHVQSWPLDLRPGGFTSLGWVEEVAASQARPSVCVTGVNWSIGWIQPRLLFSST